MTPHSPPPALDRSLDRFDMESVIRGTAGQIEFAIGDAAFPGDAMPGGDFDRVVIAGMGGSALPGEVLRAAFADQLRADLEVVRSYALPHPPDARTLVLVSSFSGTTEETISCLESLPRDFANVAVISAGGTLQELARGRFPFVRVPREREPDSFQPRCATGYFVTYMARMLAAAGVLPDPTPRFRALTAFLGELDAREDAEQLARETIERIPVVCTDDALADSLARIVKIKLNENAKRPAYFTALPEFNHNEMIGYASALGAFALVYLRDPDSHPRIHRRFEANRDLFAARKLDHVHFHEWTLPGESRLEKIFAGLTFGDWYAYSLALLCGHDPTPVDLVEEFKGMLSGPA